MGGGAVTPPAAVEAWRGGAEPAELSRCQGLSTRERHSGHPEQGSWKQRQRRCSGAPGRGSALGSTTASHHAQQQQQYPAAGRAHAGVQLARRLDVRVRQAQLPALTLQGVRPAVPLPQLGVSGHVPSPQLHVPAPTLQPASGQTAPGRRWADQGGTCPGGAPAAWRTASSGRHSRQAAPAAAAAGAAAAAATALWGCFNGREREVPRHLTSCCGQQHLLACQAGCCGSQGRRPWQHAAAEWAAAVTAGHRNSRQQQQQQGSSTPTKGRLCAGCCCSSQPPSLRQGGRRSC